ncbi:hypothetical protein [Prescottella soli]
MNLSIDLDVVPVGPVRDRGDLPSAGILVGSSTRPPRHPSPDTPVGD